MIDSGGLRDRLRWMRQVSAVQPNGEQLVTWEEAYRCRAKVTFKRGAQAIDCGEVWTEDTVSVLVRWTDRINERMRFVWDGKTYEIMSLNGRRTDGSLTVVGRRVPF